jgi:hypothetical protein
MLLASSCCSQTGVWTASKVGSTVLPLCFYSVQQAAKFESLVLLPYLLHQAQQLRAQVLLHFLQSAVSPKWRAKAEAAAVLYALLSLPCIL